MADKKKIIGELLAQVQKMARHVFRTGIRNPDKADIEFGKFWFVAKRANEEIEKFDE